MHLRLSTKSLGPLLSAALGVAAGSCAPDGGPSVPLAATRQGEAFTPFTNPLDLIRFVNDSPSLNADELVPDSDVGRDISLPAEALPYSSSYWPMTDDGILVRWQGDSVPSPAEKYGALFLTDAQQQQMYQWIEQNQGKQVPGVRSWFGICQGWAAAVLLDQAPLHAISVRQQVDDAGRVSLVDCGNGSTEGCVSFTPGDLTALLAAVYSSADARFIGERCDTEVARFSFDSSGRVQQPNCRSNAGTLFLVATNFIKQSGRGFSLCVTNNDEIWNQPAYAYRITTYRPVSELEAVKLVDRTQSSYPWNAQATQFRYVVMTLKWADEATPTRSSPPPLESGSAGYQFILELDDSGTVLGGEWIGNSKQHHPPFFWAPVGPGTQVPYLDYDKVKALLRLSRIYTLSTTSQAH